MTNAAAERLLADWAHYDDCNAEADKAEHDWANPVCAERQQEMRSQMNEALAAERRAATVAERTRILAALPHEEWGNEVWWHTYNGPEVRVRAIVKGQNDGTEILDAEADHD